MSFRKQIDFLSQQKLLHDSLRKQRRQEYMDSKRQSLISNSPSPSLLNDSNNYINSMENNNNNNQIHNLQNNQINPQEMIQKLWSNNEQQIMECLCFLKTYLSQIDNSLSILNKNLIDQIQLVIKSSPSLSFEWLSIIQIVISKENENEPVISLFYECGTIIYLLENICRIPTSQNDNFYLLFTLSMVILTSIFEQHPKVRYDTLNTRFIELLYEVIQHILYSEQPNNELKQLLLDFLIVLTIEIPKTLNNIANRLYDLIRGKLMYETSKIRKQILHIMRNITSEHKQIIDATLRKSTMNDLENIYLHENEICR